MPGERTALHRRQWMGSTALIAGVLGSTVQVAAWFGCDRLDRGVKVRGRRRGTRRRELLAGSALAGGVTALTLMANVEPSLAACVVTASPNTVDCSGTFATSNSSNLNASTSPSTANIQAFTTGGDIGVGASGSTVEAGANITGAGLAIFNFQAGSNVTVVNSGSVTNNDSGSLIGGLSIGANGGTFSYSGNGSAIWSVNNTTIPHAGLEIINSGSSSVGSSLGPVTGATFSGNNAIYIGSGTYFLLPNPPGPSINTGPVNGNISIFLQAGTLTANGTPSSGNGIGIFANADGGSGSLLIQTTGNTAINATNIGILAAGGTGSVTINTDANIGISTTPVTGISAFTSGTADVIVNQTGGAILATGTGISAASTGTGSVQVVTAGAVSAVQNGISATANGGNVSITVAPGSTLATANAANFWGIFAQNTGGNGSNTINMNGTVVDGGVFSSTVGTGSNTVNVNGKIFDSGGAAVEALSVDGAINVNETSVTIHALKGTVLPGFGIGAFASGAGDITVNMTGGRIGVDAANPVDFVGILAVSDGGTGNVSVTATDIFSRDEGIHAEITNPASLGNIFVRANGAISVTGSFAGIDAQNAGAGSIAVTNAGTITAGGAGILTTAVDGATSITNSGTVTGFFAGIDAESTETGSITVTNAGSVNATGPAGAVGIFVETNSGTALVNSTGSVTASRGIEVESDPGSIGIHANNVTATSSGGIKAQSNTGTK